MASSKDPQGPTPMGAGPWKGVRALNDPYAVPPGYLLDASNIYIPDGKGGSGAYGRPGFRKLSSFAPAIISDAIVHGRLVWVDSMSAGKAQSIGGGDLGRRPFGRYTDIGGSFDFSDTDGPDGGGQITASAPNSYLQVAEITSEFVAEQAVYAITGRLGTLASATAHRQGSFFVWRNLRGQPIAEPTLWLDLVHLRVLLHADRTLSVEWHELPGLGSPINTWHLIEQSTLALPSDGWFLEEYQWGISPLDYDKGGFFLARRVVPTGGVIGDAILHTVGTRTRGEFATPFDYSQAPRVYVPEGTSVGGKGILIPDGPVARWAYELFLGVALPIGDGDTIESDIHYEHFDTYEFDDNGDPQTVGGDLSWGDAERWKNVRDTTHSASGEVEPLGRTVEIGKVAASTSHWFEGPTFPSSDGIVRNSLRDAAMDLYRVAFLKAHSSIVALGPFALTGYRYVIGGVGGAGGGFRLPWMFSGPKPQIPNIGPVAGGEIRPDDLDFVRPENSAYEIVMKRVGGDLETNRGSACGTEWRAIPGYQSDLPGVIEDAWSASTLPQVGLRGDFRALDAIEDLDPDKRWVEVDVGLAGLDVAYRKRPLPAIVVPVRQPIADFMVLASSNLAIGNLIIQDASVDFNDGEDATITGVVSRVVDWGDGSPPETIDTGPANPASHHYALHGSYEVVLTATNAHGLTATKSAAVVVPVGTPLVASFGAQFDEGDETGMTVDFTDASSVPNGTIVSRSWDFGDGATSTATNPSHQYAAPGTYPVTLTVTDDLGRTDDFTADVTVPAEVEGEGCPLSAGALADAPNVQGDDFNGGNPPLPAWANTEAFADVFWDQNTYRGFYDGPNPDSNNGTDFAIASDKLFNGHKTLKFKYGPDSMGGWFVSLSDDGDPVESFVGTAGRLGQWARVIFSGEPGLVGTPFGGAGGGLILFALYNSNVEAWVVIRDGTVQLDFRTRLSNGVNVTLDTFDTGVSEDVFLQEGFGELVMWFGADTAAHQARVVVWVGDACTLTDAAPVEDQTRAAFGFTAPDDVKIGVRNGQVALGRMSNAEDKFGWVGLSETQAGALEDNPYGVGLPA